MKALQVQVLKNMSPVEALLISRGDSTIAPWLISRVVGSLTESQASSLAQDLELTIKSWGVNTVGETREHLLARTGL